VSDPRDQLQAHLAERYAVERELGRGGMATVYLARDLKHDRPVALKVLHPELGQVLGPERFQREIRLAARLQHPHILTVLDSGEAAADPAGGPSRLWFTMPLVDGESLRTRLQRERQLPVEDALRIGREAAQALQYAHDQGVIHRDIKPENLLLTRDGNTLVADFGIARALGAGAEEARLTETGLVVGTPAYMSPEQASGDRGLDARTDIYSLGAVLYEMLAGEPPYTGATTQALVVKRLTEPAPSVRAVRSNVSEAVDGAIRKALAPVPADRFGTAAEFARALAASTAATPTVPLPASSPALTLGSAPTAARPAVPGGSRKLTAAAFVLGLLVMASMGMLLWQRNHRATELGAAGPRLLAVLPFENIGQAADEYFADGITEAVRGKLTALPGLQVTARSSSNQYKKTTATPQQIGQELGVQYLLTGTVRWDKRPDGTSRVQVTPELIQVNTAAAKWQQPFDAAMTDVFRVQADVAERVAEALDVALGAGQREQLAEKPTANAAAYDAFLKGEAASQNLGTGDPLPLRRAIGFYEQAVALDSAFSQAWAQLSRAHSLVYSNGTPDPDGARRARDGADRALRLAPNQPGGHLALGDYLSSVQPDFEGARQAYEAGLRLSPSNADLLAASALLEVSTGQWEDALAHLSRAQALDPRSVAIARRLAYTLLRLRRYPAALAASDRGLALDPGNIQLLENKTMVFLAQGDLEAARRVVREAPRGMDPTDIAGYFGNYYDLYWVLEPDLQALLLRLTQAAFDDRAAWAIVLAQTCQLRGDAGRTRAYADSARTAFESRLQKAPEDAQSHLFLGLALAYLGRKAEAIAEGEKGLALLPIAKDAYTGPYLQHQLARIYILVGEPERALDQLEPLLKIPYYLSPGWLRIDPTFAPLRGNPRFKRLVTGT
jgi:TolB-like protein